MGTFRIGPKHLLGSGRILVQEELAKIHVAEVKTVEIIKEVPVYIDREVIKYVEVPVEKIVERIVNVPTIVEKIVQVPVEKIVEVEKRIEVPVVQTIEKIVEVPKEVIHYLDRLIVKQKVPSYMVGLIWVETALIIALIISKFV